MKKPLISVIVAVYNGRQFLAKCIDSIISQTYDNLEIILVDDGSTDNSGKICDKYKKQDSRIKVIHKVNGGVSSARNAAIDVCKGAYICIMDQDDWLEPCYVEYLYSLISDFDVEVAMVPQVIFTTDTNTFYNEKKNEAGKNIFSGEDITCLMLNGLIEIGPWNKMISTKLIDRYKMRFNTELFGGDGYLFSIESFMNAKKVAVGYKGIYHYRIDNYTSEMSKFRMRTAASSFKTVDILKDKYLNTSDKMNTALNFAEWDAYYVFLIKMIACNSTKVYKEEYKAWCKKLRKEISSLFNAQIPFSRKIKYFMIVYFTNIFVIYKRIKSNLIKQNKDRDYSKSRD